MKGVAVHRSRARAISGRALLADTLFARQRYNYGSVAGALLARDKSFGVCILRRGAVLEKAARLARPLAHIGAATEP
ncbi:MAG: hypothetical protein A3F78_07325 [Burkholderiales bacterium RIFCSPLOWO2_12_FULL_61_40]|nr:MAG: hypothetical protein A3F78_07325 [Burkholderiales bacterium RIFCSPLOWO2_12_FULL_61_40]